MEAGTTNKRLLSWRVAVAFFMESLGQHDSEYRGASDCVGAELRDVYWQREGRKSFEALALFGGVLAIGLFGKPFFHGIVSGKKRLSDITPNCRE